MITAENGKPLKWATVEVSRCVSTFRFAAEEARRFSGELQRLDTDPAAEGRMAVVRRVARGPVLGIAPFNFPLNLVAHKIAPAIAAGAPIIVKPAPRTPLSALLLGELLAETDLPEGAFSVLAVGNEETIELVKDPRLPVVSFTGSGPVGWSHHGQRAAQAGRARARRQRRGDRVRRLARPRLRRPAHRHVRQLPGRPVLHRRAAGAGRPGRGRRVRAEAARRGRRAAHRRPARPERRGRPAGRRGGRRARRGVGRARPCRRAGSCWRAASATARRCRRRCCPTSRTTRRCGPRRSSARCSSVSVTDGIDDAFAQVNDSQYGLQAGMFTRDVQTAFRARAELDVGGVIVGDVPSFRADQMPYGGVKGSGLRPRGRAQRHERPDRGAQSWSSPVSSCEALGEREHAVRVVARRRPGAAGRGCRRSTRSPSPAWPGRCS